MSEESQSEIDRVVRERLDRANAKHAEQLAAVRAELKLTEGELTRVRERVAVLEPYEGQIGELRSQIEQSERASILSGLGIPSEALPDIEAIYRSRTTGEEEPPSFGDFLGEEGAGRSLPILSRYFGEAGGPASPGVAVSPSPRVLPTASTGSPATPPPSSSTMRPEEFARWVAGPGFRNLSREAQDQALQGVGDAETRRRFGLTT